MDSLHIKGPSVHSSLSPNVANDEPGGVGVRKSMDADILIRPSNVSSFFAALKAHAWRVSVPFEDGSSFEHAATWVHPYVAPLDVHRGFPGIGIEPEAAFERLWRDRITHEIAGIECWVPSIAAQRLILLLNAARGGSSHSDVETAWEAANETQRQAVRDLARELDAEVALAAAISELDRYTDRREHDLWLLLSTHSGTPVQLWRARVKAEGNLPAGIRRGFRLIFPSRRRMEFAAGRDLPGFCLAQAYVQRLTPAFSSLGSSLKSLLPRRDR